MRSALIAALLALMLPGVAIAQLPAGVTAIELDQIDHTMTVNGKDSKVAGNKVALKVEDKGLAGFTLASECAGSPGKGRIGYTLAGGAASDSSQCEQKTDKYTYQADYKWSSTASMKDGVLTLTAQGNATKKVTRGCDICTPKTVETVEQVKLRLTATGCTIESYSRKDTEVSRLSAKAPPATIVQVYASTPKSMCSYKR